MAEKYRLLWENHNYCISQVACNLLRCNALVDCTLAAEGKYMSAHRLVLSACSPYFESLLSHHQSDKHPIFILKDISFIELQYLMDYMYKGEVTASMQHVAGFVNAAKSLQIKGIAIRDDLETETISENNLPLADALNIIMENVKTGESSEQSAPQAKQLVTPKTKLLSTPEPQSVSIPKPEPVSTPRSQSVPAPKSASEPTPSTSNCKRRRKSLVIRTPISSTQPPMCRRFSKIELYPCDGLAVDLTQDDDEEGEEEERFRVDSPSSSKMDVDQTVPVENYDTFTKETDTFTSAVNDDTTPVIQESNAFHIERKGETVTTANDEEKTEDDAVSIADEKEKTEDLNQVNNLEENQMNNLEENQQNNLEESSVLETVTKNQRQTRKHKPYSRRKVYKRGIDKVKVEDHDSFSASKDPENTMSDVMTAESDESIMNGISLNSTNTDVEPRRITRAAKNKMISLTPSQSSSQPDTISFTPPQSSSETNKMSSTPPQSSSQTNNVAKENCGVGSNYIWIILGETPFESKSDKISESVPPAPFSTKEPLIRTPTPKKSNQPIRVFHTPVDEVSESVLKSSVSERDVDPSIETKNCDAVEDTITNNVNFNDHGDSGCDTETSEMGKNDCHSYGAVEKEADDYTSVERNNNGAEVMKSLIDVDENAMDIVLPNATYGCESSESETVIPSELVNIQINVLSDESTDVKPVARKKERQGKISTPKKKTSNTRTPYQRKAKNILPKEYSHYFSSADETADETLDEELSTF